MPSWKTIELYKEFVTNGLDLLSFVLVTPEVLRAIGPTVGAISWRVVTLIASGGLLVIMTIPYQIFRDRFFPSGPSGFLESFIERAVGYVLLMIGAALVMLGLIFVGWLFESHLQAGVVRSGRWLMASGSTQCRQAVPILPTV